MESRSSLRDDLAAALAHAAETAAARGLVLRTRLEMGASESIVANPRAVRALEDLLAAALDCSQPGVVEIAAVVERHGAEAAVLRLRASRETRLMAEKWVPVVVTLATVPAGDAHGH